MKRWQLARVPFGHRSVILVGYTGLNPTRTMLGVFDDLETLKSCEMRRLIRADMRKRWADWATAQEW